MIRRQKKSRNKAAANGSLTEALRLERPRRLYQAVRFAFPQRYAIAIIVGLTLTVAAINAIEPLIIKAVFDALAIGQSGRVLVLGLAALAGFAVLREAMSALGNWLTWRTRIGLQYALLEATIGKLHKMPLRMQRSEGIGAIMTRLDRSIQGFTDAVSLVLFNVLPSVLFLAIAIVIMFQLDWRLALVVLVFAPAPALVALRAGPEQTRRERALLDRWARIYSRFNEVLSGIVVVRSFAMEQAEKARFLADVSAANRTVIRGVAVDSGYGVASNLAVTIARLWAIGFGAYLALEGEVTIGTVVAFLGYVGGLFGPVQGLSGIYSSLRKAAVSLDEIFGILDFQEKLGDSPNATDISGIQGDVRFENVHFRYEQDGRPLIDGVSFRVARGQTLAVVGPSGSGKTTLMALLMRFYDPQHGRILIDGRDIRTVKQSSLRRNIGVVLQDPLLFNDTVRANIAYGHPEASHTEILEAAKAACAHDFIERLPDGYDTLVGERGSFLSVGERQRITIARALLKDPPILVLDEATSALDAESEEAVQMAIETMLKGRTTFVIAHRLSTVVNADRIIVLQDGRIAETGNHRELVRQGGYYASLVKRQSRGLIPNDIDPSTRFDATVYSDMPAPAL
ncbi:ABC transporter ATP-binding protein [Mesorhizobium sp. BAC0120]|uniref:ABC transporter ATP-binding protein n=1 Tax=Mesorhizobium sp. BAC0120 TaxID=3090670 RepID=UPI00298CC7AD|nr:ABC transporter ATP-binding protein [Mesorhizobium sp. BAC0120]MDW6023948.1 ABC transporter ATP-binding protein [Mesorhizobium sp. BAC0120]